MSRELDPSTPFDRRRLFARGASLAAGASAFACAAGQAGQSGSTDAPAPDHAAHLDELFVHLTDRRGDVTPIANSEREQRRARLGRISSELGADAIVMEAGPTMTYLAAVGWGKSERLFALVVCADGSHFWLCPAFEESKARLSIEGRAPAAGSIDSDRVGGPGGVVVAWQEHEYPYKPLAAALRERHARRVLIEPQMRHVFADRIASELGRDNVFLGADAIVKLRARKDAHELALLRRANELTQLAIQAVAETLEPGLAGAEIGARIDRAHERLGLRSPWNLSLIGPAAATPHGDASGAKLARGDVLLMDTGASYHGYQSDITRTWVFGGQPDAEVERVWHVVRDAQQKAFDSMRPGVVCKGVDAAARSVIDAAGFGPGYRTFTHRLGHGIGLEGHEDPFFDGGSDVELVAGMTLSNEPGIYLPGKFGVRLEDIVAITDTGAEHFGAWQKGPESPA